MTHQFEHGENFANLAQSGRNRNQRGQIRAFTTNEDVEHVLQMSDFLAQHGCDLSARTTIQTNEGFFIFINWHVCQGLMDWAEDIREILKLNPFEHLHNDHARKIAHFGNIKTRKTFV